MPAQALSRHGKPLPYPTLPLCLRHEGSAAFSWNVCDDRTSMLHMLAQAINRGAAKAPSPDLAEAGADSVAQKEDGSW